MIFFCVCKSFAAELAGGNSYSPDVVLPFISVRLRHRYDSIS
jgi:hypothetical protein